MTMKMAAPELKQNIVSYNENTKSNESQTMTHREIEYYQFKISDLLYYIFSLSFLFLVIITDSIVFVQYLIQGHLIWGYFSMSFIIIPTCVIQLFSLRWQRSDGSLSTVHWILHFLFLGVLHRYLILLHTALYSLWNKQFTKDKKSIHRQESDICMLRLFESFMGSAPQLVLQLYIIMKLHYAPFWTSISAIVSFCSLAWAIGTYIKAMQIINPVHNKTQWITLILQSLWRGGMLTSRLAILVLTAICLKKWFLLFLGLHWLSMTIWVILQKTDFCPTLWEERIYNCIIGFIYCFDFFNLREGKSRYRVLIFYSVIVTENLTFLIIYILYFKETIKTDNLILEAFFITGGMLVGLISMLLYYTKFHSSKLTGFHKTANESSDVVINNSDTPRSFKYYRGSLAPLPHSVDKSQEAAVLCEDVTADKQFLLTNIVQNVESSEEGIVNEACSVENEVKSTICIVSECESSHSNPLSANENNLMPRVSSEVSSVNALPKIEYIANKNDSFLTNDIEAIYRQKRRGICFPIADSLDIDKDIVTADLNLHFPSQKRRGICSSAQLICANPVVKDKIKSNCEKCKAVLDTSNVNLKYDKLDKNVCTCEQLTDITDITLKDIKDRERLQTPTRFDTERITEIEKLSKDIYQRDEVMSCVTSIHDYENVCPLGVARPPWCIRSWKGYTDIETYLHDDSVVRDRRRDTLTSTTTGTTYSSEFSDTTCTSSLMRGVLKQDDYLDTLTYDLVDSRDSRSRYNESVAMKTMSNVEEQNATLYIAKPVVIDDKGGMFALGTILEEHDESMTCTDVKLKPVETACDSVSTLVSTIDQIRKCTTENSPRHVYHRTESQWTDHDSKSLIKKDTPLFLSDLNSISDFNESYVQSMNKPISNLTEKREIDTIRELIRSCAIESVKKIPLIDAILSDSPVLGNRTKIQKQIITIDNCDVPKSNESDLYVEMSPLVPVKNITNVDNNIPRSEVCNTEAICTNSNDSKEASTSEEKATQSSTSLRTLGINDTSHEKRKKNISYTKKKFSLLKEKFEPKSQQLIYVVTPNSAVDKKNISADPSGLNKNVSVILKKTPTLSLMGNKENVVPIVPRKDNNLDNHTHVDIEQNDNIYENEKVLFNDQFDLKERRHIFLEQVLSPSKLLSWNKRKSFVPSTKNL